MVKFLWILVIFCLYREAVVSIVPKPKIPEKVIYELSDIDELFKEFTEKHNKVYDSAEFEYRLKVFADNLIQINRRNREQPNAVYGINQFTDLTFEEFIKTHTCFSGNFTNENAIKYVPKGMAPDSLDWRESNLVTGVKNQEACGSCYIFSAIGNIEGQYAKQHSQLIELSEQQSLDCNSNGCKTGGKPHEVMQALVNKGCMRESDYPYEGQQGQCRTDQSKIVVTVTSGSQLSVGSEDELKDAVANYGPLSIGLTTNSEWQALHDSGVYTPKEPCDGVHHAVLLVGYGSDGGQPYWLIKNSWGESWNENGYLRLIRGQGACNIGQYVASATVA